ncbi:MULTISPECIES: hydroxyisourate hydrolase [unclassified Modestobacter]|uniref:hydroxyisourate hydrolase n=1 Tax=unclassified Modestobacter TaxID=2643866 RepID=UPI0022AAED3F|nr:MULTISPECIES: hydroxyisourate hydrolase [unclassified Modestobacter]MCZ2810784.1 hydroxyisourate hydrolase [Modestobacter sp. VKM Ac-2979]MCZ2815315.1 hydroxyisourate hydrolase [Modestobacter sp. VKM Ac-2984]MCZ2837679.1 hydroxyisourate hydrolase [Modestobacter sp. VKM Ac-2985]MCZ2840297.1 hydroxyisourate hydrolase [Modestobacter sp. VKM Ac-2980]MCZ2849424.1 hydroxyisourate hydrolase [Modestobacter sp. VKM Ac-2978]
MSVSTHVLDAVAGRPAAGMTVQLLDDAGQVAAGVTDADGRCRLTEEPTAAGPHRIVFGTGEWAAGLGRETFWPEVVLTFTVAEPAEHHHVPLLLSPFAYSTYRGS